MLLDARRRRKPFALCGDRKIVYLYSPWQSAAFQNRDGCHCHRAVPRVLKLCASYAKLSCTTLSSPNASLPTTSGSCASSTPRVGMSTLLQLQSPAFFNRERCVGVARVVMRRDAAATISRKRDEGRLRLSDHSDCGTCCSASDQGRKRRHANVLKLRGM